MTTLICLCLATTASAVIIDDFSVGAYSLGTDLVSLPYNNSTTITAPSGDHIIGGERHIEFDITSTGMYGQPNVNCVPVAQISTYNSFFNTNAVWTMTWAGSGMDEDLTGGASSAIIFMINGDLDDSVPPRQLPLTITVTGGGVTASSTQTDGSDGLHMFPYTDFAGVDFSHVTSISMTIVADQTVNDAMDFSISDIQAGSESTVATEESSWDGLKALYR